MFFFKQKTAYELRISDWSSDVCSSDLIGWRPTFMICGGIGLVAAIIFRLTMREPPRAPTEIPAVSLFATMRTLLSKRSYALVAAAGGTATFASFAIHQYMVSFLMRSHDMTLGTAATVMRSEEHTSELQSLMRTTYAVFRLKKKTQR